LGSARSSTITIGSHIRFPNSASVPTVGLFPVRSLPASAAANADSQTVMGIAFTFWGSFMIHAGHAEWME
jgi:hypothetical protein